MAEANTRWDSKRVGHLLYRVYRGYLHTARSVALITGTALGIGVLSVIIVVPLWFFATKFTLIYSITVAVGLIGSWLAVMAYRLIKRPEKRRDMITVIIRVTRGFLSAVMLYMIALFYARGIFIAAIPLTVVFIIAMSIIIYGKKAVS